MPEDWGMTYSSYYSAWTWFDDADEAHWGSRYIKMVSYIVSSSSAWIGQTVDVTENQEYAFSVWAKCPDEDRTSEAWGWIDWFDVGGSFISGGWLPLVWDAGNEWTYGEFGTATAPALATRAVYYLSGVMENSAMGVLFDDAHMGIPLPGFPSPPWEGLVPVGDVELSWTNLEPNDPNDSVYVKVLLGTEPNETDDDYDMEPLALVPASGLDVTSATVNVPDAGTYYWQVKSYLEGDPAEVDYDTGDPNDPNAIKGNVWSFTTATDLPPSITINTPDMITWHNEPVQLDATVIDIGDSPVFVEWMVSINNDTAVTGVTFEPNEFAEDPVVSIDQGSYSSANITNPSFEDKTTGWDGIGGTWTGTYGAEQYIVASDGYLLAYTWDLDPNTDDGLSQTLTETFAADTTYTLSVDVAHDGYYNEQVDYRVQLLAGGSILAEDNNEQHILLPPPQGSIADWETSIVEYEYDEVADANKLGEPLEIRLLAINDTQEMSFDNVRLTAVPPFPVQPGATYTLKVTATDDLGYDYTTMGIDVYEDECQMARVGLSLAAENLSDADGDCDIDLKDLYEMFLTWLDESVLTEPLVKP